MKCKAAMCAATLGLAVLPASALASGSTPVKVRIEGPKRTLLATETVRVKAGSITRYGAKAGQCPSRSMAGALDLATHHRWKGAFGSYGLPDYFVTSILGVTESGTKSYWGTFVNNRFAGAGVCETPAHAGDRYLFAALPTSDKNDYVIGVTAARTARVGVPTTVKVVSYDLKGKAHPLAGARLTGRGVIATKTDAKGLARVIPTRTGTLVLTATHGGFTKAKAHYGYVRGESAGTKVAL
jgi:hypothetical protein